MGAMTGETAGMASGIGIASQTGVQMPESSGTLGDVERTEVRPASAGGISGHALGRLVRAGLRTKWKNPAVRCQVRLRPRRSRQSLAGVEARAASTFSRDGLVRDSMEPLVRVSLEGSREVLMEERAEDAFIESPALARCVYAILTVIFVLCLAAWCMSVI